MPGYRTLHAAWIVLAAATVLNYWATAHIAPQILSIAACMILAGGKAAIVLSRFMGADRLGLPLRIFSYGWTLGCVMMITGIAWITR